jgi:hypothetical protein
MLILMSRAAVLFVVRIASYCHEFQTEQIERELASILIHTAEPVLQLFAVCCW